MNPIAASKPDDPTGKISLVTGGSQEVWGLNTSPCTWQAAETT